MNIDPRVTWLKVDPAVNYPCWKITDVAYADENQSGGNVNIYVSVLDENGSPAFGAKVYFNTTDGQNPATQTVINGVTDFPQSGDSSFDPARGESGPYTIRILGGGDSDVIEGMGLPLRRHVTYQIRFKKVLSPVTPPPPPPPTGGVTEARVKELINEALARGKF